MASKAKPLNDELKKTFYPYVTSKGFIKQKSMHPNFVEFHRQHEQGKEVFEVQWDKYWRPYFVLNFADRGCKNISREIAGRVQRKRGGFLSCWFSLHPPILYRIIKFKWRYTPNEVVAELIESFEELEQWWLTGIAGPHIDLSN